jgi:hypothetical protein
MSARKALTVIFCLLLGLPVIGAIIIILVQALRLQVTR